MFDIIFVYVTIRSDLNVYGCFCAIFFVSCCVEKQTAGAAKQSKKFYANQNPNEKKILYPQAIQGQLE